LRTKRDLKKGVAELVAIDRSLKKIARHADKLAVPQGEEGFEALIEIIVSQQLSSAAADTIFGRVKARVVPFDPPTLLATDAESLRAAGLSAPKQKHMRSIATRILSGELDLARVAEMHDDDAHAHLIETSGIGPWTAQVYLMSSLKRADVWPAGDVSLQAAVTKALGLRKRPNIKKMIALGERWRPWRTVAARLFWTHYRVTRDVKKQKKLAAAAKKKNGATNRKNGKGKR
jgi:DNA-3-methyladenine glycosylase II